MKKYSLFLLVLLCAFNHKNFAANLTLVSPAFQLNTMIPTQYTCDGEDTSPSLIWHNSPPNTQSFALIVEDPTAPNGVWTHWIVFNIPPTETQLAAGSTIPQGAATGKNSWGSLNYRGPCPPLGVHRYSFKLYALDNILSLENGSDKDSILQAMTGHVIDSVELVGLYQK